MKRFFQKLFILLLCLICFSSCATTKIITDINEYGNFPPDSSKMSIGDRIIFPENLENVKEVKNYTFVYDYILWDPTQLYLDVIYDDENFQKEIERLNNYDISEDSRWDEGSFEFSADTKFRLDEKMKLFNYPTYISDYAVSGFSYASVIEEEKRIVYVYLECSGIDEEKMVVPKIFLPKEYQFVYKGADEYKYRYSIGSTYTDLWADYLDE